MNFDQRSKGPGGYWLADARAAFSARWSGAFSFPSAGTYTIDAIWSGAVRVSLDGELIVDRWLNQGQSIEVVLSKQLGAGIHRIDVEYSTTTGHGLLRLGWGRLLPDE
jgi:type IV pilus assembly protein PilY1